MSVNNDNNVNENENVIPPAEEVHQAPINVEMNADTEVFARYMELVDNPPKDWVFFGRLCTKLVSLGYSGVTDVFGLTHDDMRAIAVSCGTGVGLDPIVPFAARFLKKIDSEYTVGTSAPTANLVITPNQKQSKPKNEIDLSSSLVAMNLVGMEEKYLPTQELLNSFQKWKENGEECNYLGFPKIGRFMKVLKLLSGSSTSNSGSNAMKRFFGMDSDVEDSAERPEFLRLVEATPVIFKVLLALCAIKVINQADMTNIIMWTFEVAHQKTPGVAVLACEKLFEILHEGSRRRTKFHSTNDISTFIKNSTELRVIVSDAELEISKTHVDRDDKRRENGDMKKYKAAFQGHNKRRRRDNGKGGQWKSKYGVSTTPNVTPIG